MVGGAKGNPYTPPTPSFHPQLTPTPPGCLSHDADDPGLTSRGPGYGQLGKNNVLYLVWAGSDELWCVGGGGRWRVPCLCLFNISAFQFQSVKSLLIRRRTFHGNTI